MLPQHSGACRRMTEATAGNTSRGQGNDLHIPERAE